ncbi:MAG: hypothetical protein AAB074_02910 [Planctomycetota bacterium]
MNAKSYFAGILTGGLFVLAGYLMGHSSPMAFASPPGDTASGFIMATPPTGANEKLIYIWDSSDSTKPRLSVYAFDGGKELTLRAHRNCAYDKLFDAYAMGGKPDGPEDMKREFDAKKPKEEKPK